MMVHREKILILGVPNTGKSTIFTRITKKYSMSANYPNTTTQEQRAEITLNDKTYELIDTPGISSLGDFSEDEFLARDIVFKDRPSMIIQCIEASGIKRSLLLTAQLLELDIPLMICLNFMDEAQLKGIWIDSRKLEDTLKVPVVETIASHGSGVDDLIRRIPNARVSAHTVEYDKITTRHMRELLKCLPYSPPPAILLLLLSGRSDILEWITQKHNKHVSDLIAAKIAEFSSEKRGNIANRLLQARDKWAKHIAGEVIRRSKIAVRRTSEKIGDLARHPVFGWVILAGVLYATYVLVARIGAVHIAGWLDGSIFIPLAGVIHDAIPWPFLRDFLVGDYGILTIGVFNAIGTVLPILAIFFLILSVLEDTGYITNLCVFTNNFLRKIGLSGKCVLPLALGFGCKTMATLTVSSLESRKERYISTFLIAFCIPCSAQLGLNLAALACFPFTATVTVLTAVIIAGITAGVILNRMVGQDLRTDFIAEIPPIRTPRLGNLWLKIRHRMKDFFCEAFPLFIVGAAVLFVMDKTGALMLLRKIMAPVIKSFLSLPEESLEIFLLCFVRHEQGSALLLKMARAGQLSYINVIVCIIVASCSIPCVNNAAAMVRKLRMKYALPMIPIITVSALLVAGSVNWLLRSVMEV